MAYLKKSYLVSYYIGKPAIAVAKATGDLTLWEDKLVFEKQLGSSLGGVFGIGGMLAARNKALKEGRTNTYLLKDVDMAQAGKYAGLQPMLTLTMKDQSQHSFVGFFDAEFWAGKINARRADKAPRTRAAEPKAPPARERPAPAPKQAPSPAAKSADKNAHENVFFFEGAAHSGTKPLGTLTCADTGLSFEGKAVTDPEPVRVSVPYSRIRSVRQDTYMKLWPLLAVETGDGKTYSFFAADLPAGNLEAAVRARLGAGPAARCKYCGHEYEPGDTFCTVCGAIETTT